MNKLDISVKKIERRMTTPRTPEDVSTIRSIEVFAHTTEADLSKISPNRINWDDCPKGMTPV